MERVKGYVVGYDTKSGELLWTVRVKEEASVHYCTKFEVASLHPGTMLTKPGDDVTFRVREFSTGRLEQEKVLKAVDVSLGLNDPSEEYGDEERSNSTISFAIVEEDGLSYAWYNECETREECQEWLADKNEGCQLLDFIQISIDAFSSSTISLAFDDEATIAFPVLKQMMSMDGIRKVIEELVTLTYQKKLTTER
mgnify:FL=1